jgi:DNA adenine methylase
MRYLGGKQQMAKRMAPFITTHEGDLYVEPFVGSGAVFERVAPYYPKAIASDANPDLTLMWDAIAEGWTPPHVITKDRWLELKHSEPSPERTYAGFVCSYGGSWFSRYVEDRYATIRNGKRYNAAAAMRGVTLRAGRLLAKYGVETCDYSEHTSLMRPGVVAYCDPPYAGTQSYAGVGEFDSERFWNTMNEWSDLGASVLVSEWEAPEGWKVGWTQTKRMWTGGATSATKVESIWVRHA